MRDLGVGPSVRSVTDVAGGGHVVDDVDDAHRRVDERAVHGPVVPGQILTGEAGDESLEIRPQAGHRRARGDQSVAEALEQARPLVAEVLGIEVVVGALQPMSSAR